MVHEYIKYISHCESFVTHSGFSRVLATHLSTNSCKPLASSGGKIVKAQRQERPSHGVV